jgi:hypothetical protein
MAAQFTIQQVNNHNQGALLRSKYAIIEGGVYSLDDVPWDQCKTKTIFQIPKSLTVSGFRFTLAKFRLKCMG